ncbi:unnamed protein product, partial [Aphanomyces euteiches]
MSSSAMRFWMLLAVVCAAVVARGPSHDLRFVVPVASTDFAESRDLESGQSRRLTASGRVHSVFDTRGKHELRGAKYGGRVGAVVGGGAGAVAGGVGGALMGTAVGGPVGTVVVGAAGVAGGAYG